MSADEDDSDDRQRCQCCENLHADTRWREQWALDLCDECNRYLECNRDVEDR